MLAEEHFTLTLFWEKWKRYQDRLKETLAPLETGQLALRSAPGQRSLGEIATHIVASRAWWLHGFMGEGGPALEPLIHWDESDAPARSASELLAAFDMTWQVLSDCLSRWTGADMQHTYPFDMDGRRSDLSRSYVFWHMLQHDLLHGGEIALTLGINGLPASYM